MSSLPTDDAPPDRAAPASSGLVLVSTPIGNLGDISGRAVASLRAADLVLCEDTRTTARLLSAHAISARTAALHEHNEDARIAEVLAMLRAGRVVALVSDAGTPLVSDPGYRLVRAAIAAGLPVTGVPGANAALLALTLSGLPPQPFLFLGFSPPRRAARLAAYAPVRAAERAGLAATLIWYEAPHRLAEMLADLLQAFGDRPAAVARELTKRFEEVHRDGLAALAAHYATHAARGEVCVLLGPAPAEAAAEADVDALLRAALAGHRLKEAVAQVTAATGLPRKQVYARALALAGEENKKDVLF
ncbi:MAG: 16S rRNA (cytidine(1402)-2'-O)-methyltransferase [Acetobacteraceae bacterium]|nr:16S rRNA (cytidine(1402)-2'-O)-methyltransferase [Acetobacteraceae bacterium]